MTMLIALSCPVLVIATEYSSTSPGWTLPPVKAAVVRHHAEPRVDRAGGRGQEAAHVERDGGAGSDLGIAVEHHQVAGREGVVAVHHDQRPSRELVGAGRGLDVRDGIGPVAAG